MSISKGLVSKIERFSIHDGDGIRTLVVMKGCPLTCRWCSSPYTQADLPEILYVESQCQGCGQCVEICPKNIITLSQHTGKAATDRSQCVGCGNCVESCIHNARELSGLWFTAPRLLQAVEKDAAFYRRSGGGVTVGGGEPTRQTEFVAEFLLLCRMNGIHTVMETCALSSWEKLSPLLDLLDLVYIDLKHMDANHHKEWTGASNKKILENIKQTAQTHELILRIPVIPGFNDDEANIAQSAKFAKTLGNNLLRLELLPYHQFGIHQYTELERPYSIETAEPLTEEKMAHLLDIARAFGITVEIGG